MTQSQSLHLHDRLAVNHPIVRLASQKKLPVAWDAGIVLVSGPCWTWGSAAHRRV